MESPSHRENILAEGMSYYGFGLAETEQGTRYGVQVFSGPGMPRELEAGAEPTPLEAAEQTQLAVEVINEAREEQDVAQIASDGRLVTAGERILSAVDVNDPDPEQQPNLARALLAGVPWRQFQLVMGSCTGCGTRPTDADVRFFVGEWLQDQTYRDLVLDVDFSHIGLTVGADGEGRKTAVAIFAG